MVTLSLFPFLFSFLSLPTPLPSLIAIKKTTTLSSLPPLTLLSLTPAHMPPPSPLSLPCRAPGGGGVQGRRARVRTAWIVAQECWRRRRETQTWCQQRGATKKDKERGGVEVGDGKRENEAAVESCGNSGHGSFFAMPCFQIRTALLNCHSVQRSS